MVHFSWTKKMLRAQLCSVSTQLRLYKWKWFIWFFGYHTLGQVEFFIKNPAACTPKNLCWTRSRHIILTALAASQSVTCLREHSTGLTQNKLTSASFSQKPIKLIVGHIIRPTVRVRWRIVNECSGRGKAQRLTGTEKHTNHPLYLDEVLFPLKNSKH